ncbi:hypothetical protein BN85411490 [Alteracholeplasma palmae J233]|uniref:Peptidase S54 rhomboid domain-containing protein n=1 Tax=Alteracholeplasma palmae (strain ATCC 49389 / J233) TaxID=1318466 RepID=U4KS50_ALTPJ|nr:rhomboid family intramembrane serine protease [Alteracholeplasma palmae]CCV64726.1 hypothetical protein BN85411490 [Alteracholeplasma palmae J233]
MNKKYFSVTNLLCRLFILIFIIDFFVFTYPNTEIFSIDHLIYGNNWGVLTQNGRLINVSEMNNEYYRLLTSIFLHAGIPHLLVNVVALYFIGNELEKRVSMRVYLSIFIFGGLLASSVTMFFTNGSVGASGSIYVLIGFLIFICVKEKNTLKSFSILFYIILILYLIIPNLSLTTALIAHSVGLVFGVVSAFLLDIVKR